MDQNTNESRELDTSAAMTVAKMAQLLSAIPTKDRTIREAYLAGIVDAMSMLDIATVPA